MAGICRLATTGLVRSRAQVSNSSKHHPCRLPARVRSPLHGTRELGQAVGTAVWPGKVVGPASVPSDTHHQKEKGTNQNLRGIAGHRAAWHRPYPLIPSTTMKTNK